MTGVFYVFAAITALFFVLLLGKEVFRRKTRLCLICTSVSLTWVALLVLYKKGFFDNVVILSMLMGQSIVGIFYLLEKKTGERFHLFKVPFLLTLTLASYSLVVLPDDLVKVLVLLAAFWTALAILFLYRDNNKAGVIVRKLIECCKRW